MERDDKTKLLCAARELGERLAGYWKDGAGQVVAVTSDPVQAAADLARAAPAMDFTVIELPHSLAELSSLAEEIAETAHLLAAPLASVGVSQPHNAVEVMLSDLQAPASRELQDRYAGRPVRWVQGTVRPRMA